MLLAAERWRVWRVISFSSAQVLGFAEGEGTPGDLPVDDAHPLRASRPYGMSKRLAEEMCDAWTSPAAIPTLVLRPVMILDDDGLKLMAESQADLGAFVHVDDVVDATFRALNESVSGHHRMTLCGPGAFESGRPTCATTTCSGARFGAPQTIGPVAASASLVRPNGPKPNDPLSGARDRRQCR